MRYIVRALLLSLLSLIIFCCYNALRFHYGIEDAILRTLLFVLEDTRWVDGFSEEKFSEITVGMTKDEVNGLLGKPLRETCITGCEWVYSWQADPTASFDWRSIHFDDFGRVESKRREFFID
jgi:hypothetical protein